MDIKIIASGSSGNCYRVSDGKTSLLLECGIPIKKIQQALDFKLSEIDACLISHEHKDHCKAVNDIIRLGIEVCTSTGTASELNIGRYVTCVKSQHQFTIGTFDILPFDTQHDCVEPLGFLIYSRVTSEKLLFATDTYYIKYKFSGISYMMIECNYAVDILYKNVYDGIVEKSRMQRLLESHFSLDNVKDFLRVNDLSKVREIYLLHLSGDNSDAVRFKREVQKLTGKVVIIA